MRRARAAAARTTCIGCRPRPISPCRKLPTAAACRLCAAECTGELAQLVPGGVDVIVNSLTSPGMLAASLAALKHGGTLVEVGKRDIWAAARVAQASAGRTSLCAAASPPARRLTVSCSITLRRGRPLCIAAVRAAVRAASGAAPLLRGPVPQERPDVSYHAVAVDFLPPRLVGPAMARISTRLAAGRIVPLPPLSYGLGAAPAALRQLAAARHVGKVVVAGGCGPRTRGAGRWVISGGTGALGVLAARSLAATGAKHVTLLGRTGLADTSGTSGPAQLLAAATSAGGWATAVTLAKGDATAAADAGDVLSGDIRVSAQLAGLPVAGVLHAGGVLRDATLPNQSLAGGPCVPARQCCCCMVLGYRWASAAGLSTP